MNQLRLYAARRYWPDKRTALQARPLADEIRLGMAAGM